MQIEQIEGESPDTAEARRETRSGRVIAVCYSPELINKVGKEAHDQGPITRWGIPGDHHYGETRMSKRQRRPVPNNRPISLVGVEAGNAACERLGITPIPPGGLGENLLLEGLGDLSDLRQGDRIEVLSSDGTQKVVFEVNGQNPPCAHLRIYHRLMPKELMNKRGVICTVLQEGAVASGDVVRIVPA
ncbi:MAG: MOSC domain-containing protein [Chloroflexota bacterium]|nr:MOSC domain-containing protein [Chloroflexota bacterium]